jgi:hypothetical protein
MDTRGRLKSQNGNEVFAGIFWARPLWNKLALDLNISNQGFDPILLDQVLKTSMVLGHISRLPPTELNLSQLQTWPIDIK